MNIGEVKRDFERDSEKMLENSEKNNWDRMIKKEKEMEKK
jgi:hypothetical protein